MVEDALSCEVVEARLLGLEFEADKREALPVDDTYGRVGSEGLGAILEDLVVDGGVTGVDDLDCLVDRLVGSGRGEDDLV